MINKAIELARSQPYVSGEQRVAAILTDKRGKIISTGVNSYRKTHPYQKALAIIAEGNECKNVIHAEFACYLKSRRSTLVPHKIYVARVKKDGSTGMAKPCKTCAALLKRLGVALVEHTL